MQCNCADLDALENADLIFIGLTHRVDVARTTSTQNPVNSLELSKTYFITSSYLSSAKSQTTM